MAFCFGAGEAEVAFSWLGNVLSAAAAAAFAGRTVGVLMVGLVTGVGEAEAVGVVFRCVESALF